MNPFWWFCTIPSTARVITKWNAKTQAQSRVGQNKNIKKFQLQAGEGDSRAGAHEDEDAEGLGLITSTTQTSSEHCELKGKSKILSILSSSCSPKSEFLNIFLTVAPFNTFLPVHPPLAICPSSYSMCPIYMIFNYGPLEDSEASQQATWLTRCSKSFPLK